MPHRKSPALLRFFLVKEQASPNDPSWLPRAESTTQGATDSYCYLCCNPASRTQTCTHARTQKHHTHTTTRALQYEYFVIAIFVSFPWPTSLINFTYLWRRLWPIGNIEEFARASLPPAPRSEKLRPSSHDPRWQLCPSVSTGLLCQQELLSVILRG